MKGRRHQTGFTLIELLVVVAIIAILAALLLAAVSRAKFAGQIARCKSNEHQMGLALAVYHADFNACPMRALTAPSGATLAWYDELSPYVAKAKWGERVYKCPAYKWAISLPSEPGVEGLGSYAYNAYGFAPNNTAYGGSYTKTLGLGGTSADAPPYNRPINEAMAKVPSDMYALGDSTVLFDVNTITHISGGLDYYPVDTFAITNSAFGRKKEIIQHTRGYNMVFLDAHVEFVSALKLFSAERIYWRRWNLDHWALGDPF